MVLSSPVVMETDQGDDEEILLHERLVEYIHALGDHSSRRSRARGVWMEHSYARAEGTSTEGGGAVSGGAVRVLLAPPPPANKDQIIDVCDDSAQLQPPAGLAPPDWVSLEDIDDNNDQSTSDWEMIVLNAGRPGQALMDALTELRLAAFVRRGAPKLRPHVVKAGQRIRSILCGALTRGEIGVAGAALRTILTSAPLSIRRLTESACALLSPGLRSRAGLPSIPKICAPTKPLKPRQNTPVLIFISLNSHEIDRWRVPLGTLLPIKFISPPKPAVSPPPMYAAELLAHTQELLAQQLHALGETPSIVCGFEAGCLIAGAALSGCGRNGGANSVKGLLALAPTFYTAEGEATLGARVRLPILAVVGECSPLGGRAAAGAAAAGGAALVLVGGAGAALRGDVGLQPALDRAVAEEVVTWAREITDPSYSSDTGTAEEDEAVDDQKSKWTSEDSGLSNSGRSSLKNDDVTSISTTDLLRLPVLLAPPSPAAATLSPPKQNAIDNATIVWSEPPTPAAPVTPTTPQRTNVKGNSNLRYTRVIVAKRPVVVPPSAAPSPAPVSAPATNKQLFVRRIPPRQLR